MQGTCDFILTVKQESLNEHDAIPDRGSLWRCGTSPRQRDDEASSWDLERVKRDNEQIIVAVPKSPCIPDVMSKLRSRPISCLNLPSSPPETEKSFHKIVHFCMRCAFEVAAEFTLSIPSWIAWYTSLSRPSIISDTLVAWLPSSLQNSTASTLSSSVGSMVSAFAQHWNKQ